MGLEILAKMKETNNRLDNVGVRLDILAELFKTNKEVIGSLEDGFTFGDKVKVVSLFESENVNILHVRCFKGSFYPLHAHKNVVEYLIVTQGEYILKLPEGQTRIITKGQCASIPPNIEHSTVAISDGAELIAICVPPEKAYNVKG